MEKIKSTKDIENMAIDYVVDYLKSRGERPKIVKSGIDIISDNKYIEVKGCMKKETNLRITQQTMDYLDKNNISDTFFIYHVFDMGKEPKLLIFDYETFQKEKKPETRWIIQPNQIKEKPELIPLKKIKFGS